MVVEVLEVQKCIRPAYYEMARCQPGWRCRSARERCGAVRSVGGSKGLLSGPSAGAREGCNAVPCTGRKMVRWMYIGLGSSAWWGLIRWCNCREKGSDSFPCAQYVGGRDRPRGPSIGQASTLRQLTAYDFMSCSHTLMCNLYNKLTAWTSKKLGKVSRLQATPLSVLFCFASKHTGTLDLADNFSAGNVINHAPLACMQCISACIFMHK